MKKIYLFLQTLLQNFIKDDCFYRASSLAYTSLLAVVPLTAIGLVIFSHFGAVKFIGERIEDFIFRNLVATSGDILQTYIAGFSQQVVRLSWIGIVALIFVVVLLLLNIENAFNRIWKLPERPGHFALLRALLRQWLTLILVPLLFAVSFIISSYLSSLSLVRYAVAYIKMPSLSLYIMPPLFIFFAFVVMYKFIPATKIYWRDASRGALLAAILFQVSKKLFILYFYLFPTYKVLYGAFAAIPLFLLWTYIVWLIVLLGAEFSWLLGVWRARD